VDDLTFAITILVCGMGGTLLTLLAMSLVMAALGRIFPAREGEGEKT
jgi:hypothetical protein